MGLVLLKGRKLCSGGQLEVGKAVLAFAVAVASEALLVAVAVAVAAAAAS